MSEFTPGLWKAWDAPSGESTVKAVYRDAEGRRHTAFIAICDCAGEPNQANARLIAAAPELYAALIAIAPEGWLADDTMDHMPGIKQARAAIAKAEGREPPK